jgi:hypothetical protein
MVSSGPEPAISSLRRPWLSLAVILAVWLTLPALARAQSPVYFGQDAWDTSLNEVTDVMCQRGYTTPTGTVSTDCDGSAYKTGAMRQRPSIIGIAPYNGKVPGGGALSESGCAFSPGHTVGCVDEIHGISWSSWGGPAASG